MNITFKQVFKSAINTFNRALFCGLLSLSIVPQLILAAESEEGAIVEEAASEALPFGISEVITILLPFVIAGAIAFVIIKRQKEEALLEQLNSPEAITNYYAENNISSDSSINASHPAVQDLVSEYKEWKKLDASYELPVKIDYYPNDKNHMWRTVRSFYAVLDLGSSDAEVLQILSDAVSRISQAQTRKATWSLTVLISSIIFVGPFFLAGLFMPFLLKLGFLSFCLVWLTTLGYTVLYGLYFIASRSPNYLILQAIFKSGNPNPSLGLKVLSVYKAIASGIPDVTIIEWRRCDTNEVVETDRDYLGTWFKLMLFVMMFCVLSLMPPILAVTGTFINYSPFKKIRG